MLDEVDKRDSATCSIQHLDSRICYQNVPRMIKKKPIFFAFAGLTRKSYKTDKVFPLFLALQCQLLLCPFYFYLKRNRLFNIIQHGATWCQNECNMLDSTMLDDVASTCYIRLAGLSRGLGLLSSTTNCFIFFHLKWFCSCYTGFGHEQIRPPNYSTPICEKNTFNFKNIYALFLTAYINENARI